MGAGAISDGFGRQDDCLINPDKVGSVLYISVFCGAPGLADAVREIGRQVEALLGRNVRKHLSDLRVCRRRDPHAEAPAAQRLYHLRRSSIFTFIYLYLNCIIQPRSDSMIKSCLAYMSGGVSSLKQSAACPCGLCSSCNPTPSVIIFATSSSLGKRSS